MFTLYIWGEDWLIWARIGCKAAGFDLIRSLICAKFGWLNKALSCDTPNYPESKFCPCPPCWAGWACLLSPAGMPFKRYYTALSVLKKAALRAATHCYLGNPILMSSFTCASWALLSWFCWVWFCCWVYFFSSFFYSFFSSAFCYLGGYSFDSSLGFGRGFATWLITTIKSVSLIANFSIVS